MYESNMHLQTSENEPKAVRVLNVVVEYLEMKRCYVASRTVMRTTCTWLACKAAQEMKIAVMIHTET